MDDPRRTDVNSPANLEARPPALQQDFGQEFSDFMNRENWPEPELPCDVADADIQEPPGLPPNPPK